MYLDEQEILRKLDQELIVFIKSKYEKEVRMTHMSDFMEDEKRRLVLDVTTTRFVLQLLLKKKWI